MNSHKPAPAELPSHRQLIFSTALAVIIAAGLLIVVVLPAERGIDPTGLGNKLHLTRMGQIKMELAKPDAPVDQRPFREDEVTVSIPANSGMELKLEMEKGYEVEYSWSADGGPVAFDLHGDPHVNPEIYISYALSDSAEQDAGQLTAIYGGYHGWYWENNGVELVNITLTTRGQYVRLRPM